MPKPKSAAKDRNTKITIETDLTEEQLKQLAKLFSVRGVARIEIPVSPNSIMKVQKN